MADVAIWNRMVLCQKQIARCMIGKTRINGEVSVINKVAIPADDVHVIEIDVDGKYIIFVEISDMTGEEARTVYEQLGDIKQDIETWIKDDDQTFFIWLNQRAQIRLEKIET